MNKPVLSIIIPVYNVEEYLERCIKSIIQQTYKQWELILVNDASKDASMQICEKYAKIDKRIIVIHKKSNEGALKARNTGLAVAQGSVIAFVDGDDWIEPNMYEGLLEYMERYQADAVEGSYYLNEKNKQVAIKNDGKCIVYSGKEALYKLHTLETITDKLWTRIYRKECIPDFVQEREVVLGEDYSHLVHIFEKCKKVVYVGLPYYHYYQRSDSVCNAGYTSKHQEVVKNCIKYREYLCEKYPEMRATVTAKLLFTEMAVLVAMTKNNKYDKKVIKWVTADVRENAKNCKGAEGYTLIMRISTMLTCINPYLLLIIYKGLYCLKTK